MKKPASVALTLPKDEGLSLEEKMDAFHKKGNQSVNDFLDSLTQPQREALWGRHGSLSIMHLATEVQRGFQMDFSSGALKKADLAQSAEHASIWGQVVASVELRPRRFPEREVLGAEVILGRIWSEHTSAKCYTPVGLGKLLERRSFTASGDVNPLQKQQKSGQVLRLLDDQLVHDEDGRSWTPRSVLAVMDGINSIRWAWVLLQLGEEDHVHTCARQGSQA
eukprot:s2136_g12.t1